MIRKIKAGMNVIFGMFDLSWRCWFFSGGQRSFQVNRSQSENHVNMITQKKNLYKLHACDLESPYWVQEPYRIEMSTESENLVNSVTQKGKLRWTSHLVRRSSLCRINTIYALLTLKLFLYRKTWQGIMKTFGLLI